MTINCMHGHMSTPITRSPRRACDTADSPVGPLHGIPVGVKDVLDTSDMPTEYGSEIYRGHRPDADSACVAALRAAGHNSRQNDDHPVLQARYRSAYAIPMIPSVLPASHPAGPPRRWRIIWCRLPTGLRLAVR